MRPDAHSTTAFENRSRQPPDISRFSIAEYERDRCQTIMAALARRYYAEAYEPGCSSGELTAQLARVCARVTATDIAPSAVTRARRRCAHLHNVNIYRADIAEPEPPGGFDLIVLSERGYYFAPSDLIRVALKLCDSLASGGELVAVHWLGTSQDHVLHGDAVHSLLLANLPLQWLKGDRQRGFRMDSWLRL
jgi:trans-aconitate methyltransferase